MDRKFEPDSFSGELTDEVRERLRARRRSLGLTYDRLAMFLKMDWTTVRKWEKGVTMRCSLRLREGLARFLSGDYDRNFAIRSAIAGSRSGRPDLPAPMRKSLGRIVDTYMICKDNEELKNRLQEDLNDAIGATLRRLAGPRATSPRFSGPGDVSGSSMSKSTFVQPEKERLP